jgi:hypothetical protein
MKHQSLRPEFMAGLLYAGGPVWVRADGGLRFRSTDRG